MDKPNKLDVIKMMLERGQKPFLPGNKIGRRFQKDNKFGHRFQKGVKYNHDWIKARQTRLGLSSK